MFANVRPWLDCVLFRIFVSKLCNVRKCSHAHAHAEPSSTIALERLQAISYVQPRPFCMFNHCAHKPTFLGQTRKRKLAQIEPSHLCRSRTRLESNALKKCTMRCTIERIERTERIEHIEDIERIHNRTLHACRLVQTDAFVILARPQPSRSTSTLSFHSNLSHTTFDYAISNCKKHN